MKLLEVSHILEIHKYGIDKFQGLDGLRDDSRAKVESILAQQYPSFGIDRYPSLFEKAAMLLYFLAKGHCFPDGNKRVAIMAAVVFLEINGYETTFDDDEGYKITIEVSSSSIPEPDRIAYIKWLARWLRGNCQPVWKNK